MTATKSLRGGPAAAAYLNADIPVATDKDERLGRIDFVRLLARRVLSYRSARALVVGICGPWGSGKTSIVNLVMNEVRAARPTAGRPVLEPVKFTPWSLGSRDDLAQDMLREIGRMVGTQGRTSGALAEVGPAIVEVGTALTVAHSLNQTGVPGWVSTAVGALGLSGRAKDLALRVARKRTAPTLQEATEKVSAKLRSSGALLVVALDDLERLPADQIHAVFRVVSAIADFPNTVYLLSMDRHRVAEALKDEYGDGHAYLEKFLNLTFDVPRPDPDLLGTMFVDELNRVLSARQVEADAKRFGEVWQVGLKRVVRTPRDVVRVINSFDMALEAIGSETDPVDLLALEALRVLEPGVHHALAENAYGVLRKGKDPLLLLGMRSDKERTEKGDADLEVILSKAGEDGRDSAKLLLEAIFPAARRGGHVDENSLHRARRAASIDHFDHYFRWSMASGSLTEAQLFREIDDLARATRDVDLQKWFERNGGRFSHLAEKLFHYVEEAGDVERRYDVAAGLVRLGHMLEDRGSLFILRSAHMTAISLAYHLIRRNPEAWDSELWRRCSNTSWLYALTHMISTQTRKKDRLPDLSEPSVETRAALSEAIEKHLEGGRYDDHPALAAFLYRWGEIRGDDSRARDWLRRKVGAGDRLVWLMLDPIVNVSGMLEAFGDHHQAQNRQNLDALFDVDALRAYVTVVPHPRDNTAVVAATRRALDLE